MPSIRSTLPGSPPRLVPHCLIHSWLLGVCASALPAAAQEPVQAEDLLLSERAPPAPRGGEAPSDDWSFKSSGYFRAPRRLGIGRSGGPEQREEAIRRTGRDVNPDGEAMVHDANGNWTGETLPSKV